MRAVLQRVIHGAVRVDDQVVGAIDHGFVILVGVGHADGSEHAFEAKHTLSSEQIAWFRAGSALNVLRQKR